jgi:acyl-coenzyme A thioesterase PaaI-like protein
VIEQPAPTRSLQLTYFPDMRCFGCGPANDRGLRLQSFATADGVVAEFEPWPEHDNGLGFLNGGIIATLLDCHSAAAVTHEAYARGWPPLPGASLPFVTSGLDVSYLRPAPLTERVSLVAEIAEATEAVIRSSVRLEWDGKTRAEATATWKRWRPR